MRAHELNEVIDGSDWPIQDHLASASLRKNYAEAEPNLEKIGTFLHCDLFSTEWPMEAHPRLFLVKDGKPIGEMDLFVKNTASKMYRVSYVCLEPEYQRKGIGIAIYGFLLEHGYILRSDKEHTSASKALWKKLAQHYHVKHNGEKVTDTSLHYDGQRSYFTARKLTEGLKPAMAKRRMPNIGDTVTTAFQLTFLIYYHCRPYYPDYVVRDARDGVYSGVFQICDRSVATHCFTDDGHVYAPDDVDIIETDSWRVPHLKLRAERHEGKVFEVNGLAGKFIDPILLNPEHIAGRDIAEGLNPKYASPIMPHVGDIIRRVGHTGLDDVAAHAKYISDGLYQFCPRSEATHFYTSFLILDPTCIEAMVTPWQEAPHANVFQRWAKKMMGQYIHTDGLGGVEGVTIGINEALAPTMAKARVPNMGDIVQFTDRDHRIEHAIVTGLYYKQTDDGDWKVEPSTQDEADFVEVLAGRQSFGCKMRCANLKTIGHFPEGQRLQREMAAHMGGEVESDWMDNLRQKLEQMDSEATPSLHDPEMFEGLNPVRTRD
jgi:GNAT superfamily N-acetyltransferase